MTTSGLLFDLYGTLLDIDVNEQDDATWAAVADFLHRNGAAHVEPQALHRRFREIASQPFVKSREGFVLHFLVESLLREFLGRSSTQLIRTFTETFRSASIRSLDLRPYALPLLKKAKEAGRRVAIVSNTEALVTRVDLRVAGLASEVDAIVLSSQVGSKKPSRHIFSIALRKLAVRADQSIFCGDDWEADILGAVGAGLSAVHLDKHVAIGAVEQTSFPRAVKAHPDIDAIEIALNSLGAPL
ncbi:MAG: putative hydrolase of the superfamily [Acidimicrobiaceae bacterium]|jgi:putative hydrolase of the HAD superfamily